MFIQYFPKQEEVTLPRGTSEIITCIGLSNKIQEICNNDKEYQNLLAKKNKLKSFYCYEYERDIRNGLDLSNPIHKAIHNTMQEEMKQLSD